MTRADGFDFFDLVESSDYDTKELFDSILDRVNKYIEEPHLRRLVHEILDDIATCW